MSDFEPRERREPIPNDGWGAQIEQAELDYANGIGFEADAQSPILSPVDEADRLGVDIEDYLEG